MCPRVFVTQVVDIAGRNEREPGALGQAREQGVDPRLRLEPRVPDLDVGLVATEDLDELATSLGRLPGVDAVLYDVTNKPPATIELE